MRREGDYFQAYFSEHCDSLLSDRCESIEKMRETIDKENERRVYRGYEPIQFTITHTEWYKWFEDNGSFKKSETLESFVERYPQA